MSKTFKRALILLAITVPFALLIPYIALNLYGYVTLGGVPIKPIPVDDQYRDAFNSTCGIHAPMGTATGILLDTGYVLTAMHVVDVNGNGLLDQFEKKIQVEFYAKEIADIHTGTVIYGNGVTDFAVVAIPDAPKSNVKLMSDEDYERVGAGAPIFAIGRSMGQDPPHFTRGIRSTDSKPIRDRAGISIFFGNSGGGLFDESSGELIGLASRVEFHHGILAPSWAEYVPPDEIRKDLSAVGLEHTVDLPEKPFNWAIHLYPLLGVLIIAYVIVRRRRLRQEVCDVCGDNA